MWDTRYARVAKESYGVFVAERAAGNLSADCRFQVDLPTPMAPVAGFVTAASQALIEPAYERALLGEIDEMAAAIPHQDLAIQWDVAREFMFVEGIMKPHFGDVMSGITDRIARISAHIPDDIELGYHLCYGDVGHKHFIQPADAGNLVKVANAIAGAVKRPIAWLHMPVPIDRADDAFYAPLKDFALHPETRLFLGLVHHTDGAGGTRKRMATARRHLADFGIATECGMGRRDLDTITDLIQIHASVLATA